MKQQWTTQELLDHWTLTPQEMVLIRSMSQTAYNQLGSGTLYKWFQNEGDFPKRKQDISSVIVDHIADQLQIPRNSFNSYTLPGRTVRRHQRRIRQLLQFRAGTVADARAVLDWLLIHDQLLEDHNFDRLKEIVYER